MIRSAFQHRRPLFGAIAICSLMLVGACADKQEEYVERPVEELYNEAMDLLDKDEFSRASKAFEEVERQHPYSVWATKAQLMSAYAMYERNKYDDAIIALDRFIQLHPGNRDTPYAYYLKGLSYYEQIADVGRDQKMTEMALKSLQEVVDRFPTSQYARDAKLKVDLTRDHLAGKEMAVGRYYLKNGSHLAALNRFKVVVEQYQVTTHVPEALHRMVEVYMLLGLDSEAKRTAAVLGHNYPGNEWYEDTFSLIKTGQPASGGRKAADEMAEPASAKRSGWFGWAKFW